MQYWSFQLNVRLYNSSSPAGVLCVLPSTYMYMYVWEQSSFLTEAREYQNQISPIHFKSDKWMPCGYKNYIHLIPKASSVQSQQIPKWCSTPCWYKSAVSTFLRKVIDEDCLLGNLNVLPYLLNSSSSSHLIWWVVSSLKRNTDLDFQISTHDRKPLKIKN
jgi:hypothetical protein